jgi:DNA repair photolyase
MEYLTGKGAQINVPNKYSKHHLATTDLDGLDEEYIQSKPLTEIFYETPKKILSYNESTDIGVEASLNPYQGCEHGCVYCYARNTHEYWGFSSGLDFESKIIVKKEAPRLLEKTFLIKKYNPKVIMLSGNTDCYQPLEKKFKLTRQILKVCLKYQHPISLITKNVLVARDIDLLKQLSENNLVQVIFSITTQDESLRRILEPRTATAKKKFETMKELSSAGIPVGVMAAPIIPSINHQEIPNIIKKSVEHGASFAGYTVIRLNGQVKKIVRDWLIKNFPNRVDKVWRQIQALHGGVVNDSKFGRRITGEGEYASIIEQLFVVSKKKYLRNVSKTDLDCTIFRRGGNYSLF